MAIRTFPTAFKLKVIKRAEGGEGILPVTRKLESFVHCHRNSDRRPCRTDRSGGPRNAVSGEIEAKADKREAATRNGLYYF
jgi:hypothetical protein